MKGNVIMASTRCLYCYQPSTADFHPACSRKFFGTTEPPEFPYALSEMHELASQVILRSVSVTGVQAKLSVDLAAPDGKGRKKRLTIVGMWGHYILKPPTEDYPCLPETEDLTMHIAELFKVRTVPHSLIRIKSGELAYLTKRVDRRNGKKVHMEDMCQLSERLTEDKYKGSMEQVGKVINLHAENRGFDALEFFRLALVSFLTGNADMHLKNFSLLHASDGSISLAPAYDLVATKLILPEDKEETALTVNGKKGTLRESDFRALAESLLITDTVYKNTLREFEGRLPNALAFLNQSFLTRETSEDYASLLKERAGRLGLVLPGC
jgi:serine/threonine-protein kinase HipA